MANRILTTHVGSLPRPHDVLDMMKAKLKGEAFDRAAYEERLKSAVAGIVRQQAESGIDVLTDGEVSKPGFFTYIRERLSGFEPRPGAGKPPFEAERKAFPEYYEEYFKRAMYGGAVAPVVPLVCISPVEYRGHEVLQRDIRNLKNATSSVKSEAVFMPSVAPSGVGLNEYYSSQEEYVHAVAEAMRTEYKAIVDAGLLLQIDDPFLCDLYGEPNLSAAEKARKAILFVEALNHALRGIPEERVRYHTCYGINEGPRVHEADLSDVIGHMLNVHADFYSFEAANARHEHEYHLWETVKLPEGKALIPGVVTHASNIVEHPDLIAERIVRFAKRVGRENVIAGTDCGFSSQATYRPEVHPTVMWAKFRSMAEGARRATRQLWG
jgi:5-methyltetrahydropteroyltriglutamate--homocysteine methyltransferase